MNETRSACYCIKTVIMHDSVNAKVNSFAASTSYSLFALSDVEKSY